MEKPCDRKISDGEEKITEEKDASVNERQKERNDELDTEEEKTQELYETEEGTAMGSEVGEKQEVVGGDKERKGNAKNETQHEVEVKEEECSVKTQVQMSLSDSPVDHQTDGSANQKHGTDELSHESTHVTMRAL